MTLPPAVLTAQPSALGDRPKLPGLRADERNILVGDEGVIHFNPGETRGGADGLPNRLSDLLGFLSQKIILSENVVVQANETTGEVLLRLTRPDATAPEPSRFYDDAAEAARFSGAQLYVGRDHLFVQYRDGSSPRGYDAQMSPPSRQDEIWLVGPEGTVSVQTRALRWVGHEELLLRIRPSNASAAEPQELIYALVAPPLYRVLANYFRDHYMRFRVARFYGERGNNHVLFEIRPSENSPTGPLVPAFVISYLNALPRVVALTDASVPGVGRRLLVQWGHRYPCLLQNVSEVFQPESLVAFTASPFYQNVYVTPAPTFFEDDGLTSVKMHDVAPARMSPAGAREAAALELPLRLVDDTGLVPPTAALLLDVKQVEWLRLLLYRLPEEAFTAYSICIGDEGAVLMSGSAPVETIPFGVPMQKVRDTGLFIPLRKRFSPSLSWPLLSKSLSITDEQYTFLRPDSRLDVPRASFAPLSRLIVAERDRPRVTLSFRPEPRLPALKWKPAPRPAAPTQSRPATQRTEQSRTESEQRQPWWDWRRREAGPPSGQTTQRQPQQPPRPGPPQNPNEVFRARAEEFLRNNDFLGAAFCYVLLGDKTNAAKFYRAAAERIKEGREGAGQKT
ncbi:MAG: hypothetical protein ABW208_15615 [Pyrinomonadaceae bacterium]